MTAAQLIRQADPAGAANREAQQKRTSPAETAGTATASGLMPGAEVRDDSRGSSFGSRRTEDQMEAGRDTLAEFQTRSEQIRAAAQERNAERNHPYAAALQTYGERVRSGTATAQDRAVYDAVQRGANAALQEQQTRDVLRQGVNAVDSFLAGGKQALGGVMNLAGTVDEAVTRGLLGQKDYQSAFKTTGQEDMNDAARRVEANKQGTGVIGSKVNDLAAAAGSMLMTGMMGQTAAAGAGAAAGAAQTGERIGSAGEKLAEAVRQIGSRAGQNLVQNAGLYTMGASAAGASAMEAELAGADTNEQLLYGVLSGAAEVASEKLFGGNPLFDDNAGLVNKLIGKVVKNGKVMDFLASKPAETFGEGLEEVVTAVLSPVFQRLSYDPDADAATLEEIAGSFLDGVLLSGVMQGASAGIEAVGTMGARAAQNQAVQAQQQQSGAIDRAYQSMMQNGMFQDQTARMEQSGLMPGAVPSGHGTGTMEETGVTLEGRNSVLDQAGDANGAEGGEGQKEAASTGEAGSVHHGEILDTIRGNLSKVREMEAVASLTGAEFQKTAEDNRNLRTKVIDFFNRIGNKVTRKDLGDIELNTAGARDSLAHGYGKLKAATFAALPQVLENGKLIAHNGPYEGHNYDSYLIAAPVKVGEDTVYVGALVIKDLKQRYKLHEVLTTNENGASLFKSETTSRGADGPLRNDTPFGAPEGASTDPTIPQAESGVKGQDRQNGGKDTGERAEGGEVPIAERTWKDAGDRTQKAYQFTHPELHDYYVEAAKALQADLNDTVHGERYAVRDQEGYITGGTGTKRMTSEPVAHALDDAGLTYDQIGKAIDAIIRDSGQENYAAAKKVELVLDEMLADGYTDITGEWVPPNEDYLQARDGLPQGTGAASLGFDPVSNWQNQKSEFYPTGEAASRDVQMPTEDLNGRRVSRSVRTVAEAQAMPEEMADMILQEAANGAFSYDPIKDKASVQRADDTIRTKGWDGAFEYFRTEAERGVVSKDLLTLGAKLMNNAANSRDGAAAAKLLSLYASMSRAGAQATQANRIFKKLSPEWQLYGIQQSVDHLQETLNKRFQNSRKDAPNIQIDAELVKQFQNAGDEAGRQAAMDAIYQNVADQVPATWQDKWNAWRYLSMLANPRTHIRNVAGNLLFQPLVFTKGKIGAVLETTVDAANRAFGGKGIERTKAFLADPALYQAAWDDFPAAKTVLMNGSKYSETDAGQIKDRQTVFRLSALEWARKKNSAALEAEDAVFKRITYTGSLAEYLAAHGVTAAQVKGGTANTGVMDAARAYAAQEAMKATYNDSNAFSDWISHLGSQSRNSANPAAKAAGIAVEGVLPFKRTPANIVARGMEYSPIGLARGVVNAVRAAGGTKTAAEAIDQIAAGLTGTGLMALGCLLASLGMVTGGGSGDDKQDKFDDLNGSQDYALQLDDGTSFTLDWMAPEALPFFMGVEAYNQIARQGYDPEHLFQSIVDAGQNIMEPMLELSMLQSLNDVLESVSFADNKLSTLVSSAATSYLTQGIPTILGQLERTIQDDENGGRRMTTYTDQNGLLPTDLQYTIGKASARLPGWDYQQIPYIDAWGRTERSGTMPERAVNNLLNPAYLSHYETDETDDELQRLYNAGQTSVFPSSADKWFNVNGERVDLDAEQYQTYAVKKGQVSRALVEDLMQTNAYQTAGDGDKARMIANVYDYANQTAKAAVSGFEPESWVEKARAYSGGVAEYIGYKLAKAQSVDYYSMPNSEDRFAFGKSLLEDSNLTAKRKTELYKSLIGGDDTPDFSSEENFYLSQMGEKANASWKFAEDAGLDIADWYEASKVSGSVREKLDGLMELGYSEEDAYYLYALLNYKDPDQYSMDEIWTKVQRSLKASEGK